MATSKRISNTVQADLVRGILTGLELAKSCTPAVTVDLPLGWQLEAQSTEISGVVDAQAVDSGVEFTLCLPDGTELSTWKGLARQLREVLAEPVAVKPKAVKPKAVKPEVVRSEPEPEANGEDCRRGSRKRHRPLEFWANERVVYEKGVCVGAIVHSA